MTLSFIGLNFEGSDVGLFEVGHHGMYEVQRWRGTIGVFGTSFNRTSEDTLAHYSKRLRASHIYLDKRVTYFGWDIVDTDTLSYNLG